MLESSENDVGLEDFEPEDCDPPEDNTGLEEEYQQSEEDCEEADADHTFSSENGQIKSGLLLHFHRGQGDLQPYKLQSWHLDQQGMHFLMYRT